MKKNISCFSIFVFSLAALVGCSASVSPSPQSGPPPVGPGPVSGTIQGQAWAMVNGEAHPNQGTAGNLFQINLWPNSSRQPCSTPDVTSINATQVYAYVHSGVGTTNINIFSSDGTSFSFNYINGSTSTIDMATQGNVTLTSVTSTQRTGCSPRVPGTGTQ